MVAPAPLTLIHDGEVFELMPLPLAPEFADLDEFDVVKPRDEWAPMSLLAPHAAGTEARPRRCPTFDAIASALLAGSPVAIRHALGGNFLSPGEGGLVEPGGRKIGGCELLATGLVQLPSGDWTIRVSPGWGPTFGVGGFVLMGEGHFSGGCDAATISAGTDGRGEAGAESSGEGDDPEEEAPEGDAPADAPREDRGP